MHYLINKDKSQRNFLDHSYSEFYCLNEDSISIMPLHFCNSTNIEFNTRGFYSPVEVPDNFFPGAINIAREMEKDTIEGSMKKGLSFSRAVFMSNRFPYVSPASKVENVGHFVDAGYFDNSGLLSAFDIKYYLEKTYEDVDSLLKYFEIKIIRITNSNVFYMTHHILSEFSPPHIDEIMNANELIIPLRGVSEIGTTGIPYTLERTLNRLDTTEYYHISLPYRIDSLDFQKMIKKDIFFHDEHDTTDFALKLRKKNAHFDSILDNIILDSDRTYEKYIPPPLGRLLSDPITRQMKAQLDNKCVQDEINKIIREVNRVNKLN